MQKNLSLYLDALRLLAATAVFLAHESGLVRHIPYVGANGPEAVACFFVLSGFVIAFVGSEKERSLQEYAVARISRIYPVAIMALLVTYACDKVGIHIAPQNYIGHYYFSSETTRSLLLDLTFLNQAWFNHGIFGSDEPFWSLGFEVPYYEFFAIMLFLRGWPRAVMLGVFALVIGPVVLAYAPLWATGAATYWLVRRRSARSNTAGLVLLMASLAGYVLARLYLGGESGLYVRDGNELFKWLYYILIGLLVSISILGASYLKEIKWNSRIERGIRWLANGSFTLYLVHQPILLAAKSLFPQARDSVAGALLLSLATLVACFLLAEVAERRKVACRRFAHRALNLLRPPTAAKVAGAE